MQFPGFEKFTRSTSPAVSITYKGFGLGKRACQVFSLNRARWAELYFHEKKSLVAIRPLKKKEPGAVRLHFLQESGTGFIESRRFFRRFNLDQDSLMGRYEATPGEDGFVIDLKNPITLRTHQS